MSTYFSVENGFIMAKLKNTFGKVLGLVGTTVDIVETTFNGAKDSINTASKLTNNVLVYGERESEYYLASQTLSNERSLEELTESYIADKEVDEVLKGDKDFQKKLKELRIQQRMQDKLDSLA